MLGLNPMEQEIIDVTNEIARNGLIYFPEFCRVVHTRYSTVQYSTVWYITLQYNTVQYSTLLPRYRAEDEEVFRQNMFKVGVN